MDIRSVGLATDLALLATRGRIVDRGDYIVTLTPDDPSYYYGNTLVLPAPPQQRDLARWLDVFAREVAIDPEIRHVTLCWDGIVGDGGPVEELAARGFVIERAQVMAARDLAGPELDVELRPLTADELARAADLAFEIGDRHDDMHRRFLQRRSAWHRELVGHGVARFWGAFERNMLIGSLGVVRLGRTGRYQDVQTAPDYRRRGIASALLAAAAHEARDTGIEEVVIVALPGSGGERAYERVGFRTIEQIASACRYPT